MSDIDDDSGDEFDLDEYFYVEDTYDEVGDLAEHAIASPPPFDDGEDMWDWDRFAYWNDIEYDSDGYHDVDTERGANRKGKGKLPQPKGKLKRRLDEIHSSPAKRRKGRTGATHEVRAAHEPPKILISPVGWKDGGDEAKTPLREIQDRPFALLKNWREQFPDTKSADAQDDQLDVDNQDAMDVRTETLQIDQEALMAALRANLGKLGGETSGGAPGGDEELLMQHITKLMGGGAASLDDIAGDLADALFAPDDESVASEALHEKKGDGDFGQWVLTQAEGHAQPSGVARRGGELSPPADDNSAGSGEPAQTPMHTHPADRRPPTPASAQSSSSGQMSTELLQAPAPSTMPADPSSRKRKATTGTEEDAEMGSRSKRSLTRSFDAPTASSRARSTRAAKQEKGPSRTAARKASKAVNK